MLTRQEVFTYWPWPAGTYVGKGKLAELRRLCGLSPDEVEDVDEFDAGAGADDGEDAEVWWGMGHEAAPPPVVSDGIIHVHVVIWSFYPPYVGMYHPAS